MLRSGDATVSFWEMQFLDRTQALMVLGGYALAAAIALLGIIMPPFRRWQALVAVGGFAFVLIKLSGSLVEMVKDYAIGGKAMVIAAFAGLALAATGVLKPDDE